MKWNNRGHEFDSVYVNISSKKSYYFFGAGDYGKQFLEIMKDEIVINGFIDNDKKKLNIDEYDCKTLDEIKENEEMGIIITVSQMQRGEIIKELINAGYVFNKNFFLLEEFLSIYFAYKYNKVYFSSISFLPSTICNLKCRACLNFNPYAKNFYIREWEDIKADIDLFFQCVDKIMLFHVSGGEPMLYNGIADIIEYIDKEYGNRIGTLRTVTNGTIVPDDVVLERLSKCDFEITVDDYREAVPQYNEKFAILIKKLEKYQIKYQINKIDEWIDLAPDKTDFSHWSEDELEQHFNECCQAWQELRDGKLYSCNYDAYATVAGINPEQDDEIFDLHEFEKNKKKELVEFRLGYNAKGYTNFCRKCRGFSEKNPYKEIPARQKE